jgi:hypothetical protein
MRTSGLLLPLDRSRPATTLPKRFIQFRTDRPAGARRRDIIRMHMTRGLGGEQRGLNRMTIDVLLADGRTMTADEYRALRRGEEDAAARRRLLELRGAPRVGAHP